MASYYDWVGGEVITAARLNAPYDATGNLTLAVAGRTLGTLAIPLAAAYFDNGGVDGGSIYFNSDITRYIQSNAAGTVLTIAGFTTVNIPGLNITGNLAVTGTVDGVDVSAHAAATAGVHGAVGTIVGTTDAQTLSNKVLTTPTIASFVNATHDHSNLAGGGNLDWDAVWSDSVHNHNGDSEGGATINPVTITIQGGGAITYSSAQTRYLSIGPSAFVPRSNTAVWLTQSPNLRNNDPAYGSMVFFAPVHLPHGAIVTAVTMWYARNDAASSIVLNLSFDPFDGSLGDFMSTIIGTDVTGSNVSLTDNTIASATIDNSANSYNLQIAIDNNDGASDALLVGVLITYTVTAPLP